MSGAQPVPKRESGLTLGTEDPKKGVIQSVDSIRIEIQDSPYLRKTASGRWTSWQVVAPTQQYCAALHTAPLQAQEVPTEATSLSEQPLQESFRTVKQMLRESSSRIRAGK